MADGVHIERIRDALPGDIDRLRIESEAEGHRHVTHLIAEWRAGTNRFCGTGEALLAAFAGADCVGIGGATHDPYLPGACRMRRFYVARAWRGRGLARQIALAVLADLPAGIPVTVRSPAGATGFWVALGFRPVTALHHNLVLDPALRDRAA